MLRRHDLKSIMRDAAPHTMVCEAGVRFTIHRSIEVIEREIPGHMVECGVWRGGCGLAMLLAQRAAFGEVLRPVHFMDSFSGLPPVDPRRDGRDAVEWQASTVNNCAASREQLELMLNRFNFVSGEFELWEGLFEDTLPEMTKSLDQIALLRLDGDWYKSTRECLDALLPLVSPHGTVIVDDYYAWDGCARAVHDHLSSRDLPYRIKSLAANYSGAYFEVRE